MGCNMLELVTCYNFMYHSSRAIVAFRQPINKLNCSGEFSRRQGYNALFLGNCGQVLAKIMILSKWLRVYYMFTSQNSSITQRCTTFHIVIRLTKWIVLESFLAVEVIMRHTWSSLDKNHFYHFFDSLLPTCTKVDWEPVKIQVSLSTVQLFI